MATSFIVMSSEEQPTKQQGQQAKSSAEAGGGTRRSSRGKKGPKKQPQRGLGVFQLEKLRMQECLKKMADSSSSLPPSAPHQILPFDHPLNNTAIAGGVPAVRYAVPPPPPPPNHFQGGVFQWPPPQHVFMGGGAGGGWVVGGSSWGPHGTPLAVETSAELSSMPNTVLHRSEQLQHCFDVSLKKTRYNNEDSARRGKSLDIGPNAPHFMGCYIPQPADNDHNHNHYEGVEVVAVHRKRNPMSGRVLMEYEFFPEKDGRDTCSKELEFPSTASLSAMAAEPACNCNTIDLSLKLSR